MKKPDNSGKFAQDPDEQMARQRRAAHKTVCAQCEKAGQPVPSFEEFLASLGRETINLSTGNGGEGGEEGQDLNALTVADLKALAAEEGVELEDKAKKADIIAAIEAKRAE